MVRRAQAGDRGATDELFTSLYNELHRLARREVYRSGPHGLLSTTTLLHEAYLDISRRDALAFADAGQFLAYAARAVRKSAAAAWTSPRSTPRSPSRAPSPRARRNRRGAGLQCMYTVRH
jgi:hypothetical protein